MVHAFRGKEFAEYDNPVRRGMTGLIGFSSGDRAMEHCDALVMLGTDFPYRPFYPDGVPVILAPGCFLPHRLARRRRQHPGQLTDHPAIIPGSGPLPGPARPPKPKTRHPCR